MDLFSYFKGKKDVKHSKFPMNFQNLFTSNFGQLTPVATYEVLGGDSWTISQNTITKVAPMPAPAFARIKQNFYSFYVPNQTVWKHWNDFITNGTAYLDTYGNNQTNQEITNQWSQPSVFVNDLQLQTKLANGWALPVFRLKESEFALFTERLGISTDYYSTPDAQACTTLPIESDDQLKLRYWSVILSNLRKRNLLPSFFNNIPYMHPCFGLNKVTNTDSSGNTYFDLYFKMESFAFCCDFHTMTLFYKWLHSTDSQVGQTLDMTRDTTMANGDESTWSYNNALSWFIGIRYFCDTVSDDLRLDHGPFMLSKTNFVADDYVNNTLTTYTAEKNLYDLQTFEYDTYYENVHNLENPTITYTMKMHIVVQRAGFYSRSFGIGYDASTGRSNDVLYYMVNGIFFEHYSTNPLPYESIEQIEWAFGIDRDFLGCHCGQRFFYDNASAFLPSAHIGTIDSFRDLLFKICDGRFDVISNYNWGYCYPSPFFILNGSSLSSPDNLSLNHISERFASCDVFFSLYPYQTNPNLNYFSNSLLYDIGRFDISTQDSFSLGFDAFGFMVYQAKSVSKLLDYFNIPQEGFTARSWEDYAGELINCLPMFGYSKIYNDYFRNTVTTSAELDYKETNGVALLNYSRLQYLIKLKNLNVPLSRQVLQLIEDNHPRSWVIPMCTAPKSGLSFYSVDFTSGERFLRYTENEYHYFNLENYQDLFCLLSGWQLTDQFVRKILNFVVKTTIGGVEYMRLRGMLLENVYLPNYYNGLLHMKFQNFSKDYFSSALLDPMHGANEVQIGDTISDLRSEIVQQNFWETFAMARSVKHAFQSMMGVTPKQLDYDKPLLLGMDHMPINIGEVIQTSQTDITPQGKRSGLAAAHGSAGLCKHHFEDVGYIIILSSFTVEQQYFQGLEHQWTPFESFLDYPWSQMAHIGNESIPLRELKWSTPGKYNRFNVVGGHIMPFYNVEGSKVLMDGRTSPLFITDSNIGRVDAISNTVDKDGYDDSSQGFDEIFGYIPRNSNYKFKLDQVHGAFRNQMDYWQTFRKFYKKPMLTHEFVNWEFVADDGDLNRLFAVEDENVSDKFYCDCYINATVSRQLPYVNVPSTK